MANIQERINQHGGVSYRVQVRLKGYPVQTATFQRKTDARIWAQQTETAIREGRHFKTVEAKRHTLAEAIDRYIKFVLPNKPKSLQQQTTQLNWWKEQIGHHLLADVTPALLGQYRDKLANTPVKKDKKRSSATVNRYMAALSHFFSIALREWGWVDDNPFRKVTKKKEPGGRVRYLSDEERESFLQACRESTSKHLYVVVVLALSTGARRMEVLGLKWQNVDFQREVITLHETKNGERRVLPLSGLALELMKEHGKVRWLNCDYVFPNEYGTGPVDIKKPFQTALKRAGITEFRFHDLRHSAASYLAMNGASPSEIAAVLGHKTLVMVKRYAHLSEVHTAAVVAKMNEKIFRG